MNKLYTKYNEFINEGIIYNRDEDENFAIKGFYAIMPNDFWEMNNMECVDFTHNIENVHFEIKDLYQKLQNFIKNDEKSQIILKEYKDTFYNLKKVCGYNIKHIKTAIFKDDCDQNKINSLKDILKNINTEFHINLFKHFPDELKNKYSQDWISKNISKTSKLLL